jgi:HSP20 family protein
MSNLFKKIIGIDENKNTDENNNFNEENYDNSFASDQKETEENSWLNDDNYEEGQLSIDVYEKQNKLIVKSTIAGVKTEDIDISINNDMLTIRGKREETEKIEDGQYLYRECYWGAFSRSVILPVEVQADKIDASLENGVLTIILPKAKSSKQISIKVKG